jgi:hypothetical protein
VHAPTGDVRGGESCLKDRCPLNPLYEEARVPRLEVWRIMSHASRDLNEIEFPMVLAMPRNAPGGRESSSLRGSHGITG